MINAKEELLLALKNKKIKCAEIKLDYIFDKDEEENFILKINYTEKEYEDFINSLDFRYDNGYGSQLLFGIIWLENNEWLERVEYDGSEWWTLKSYPIITDELLNNK